MSLFWMVGLAAIVLAEKVLRDGRVFSTVLGVSAIAWATWLLTSA